MFTVGLVELGKRLDYVPLTADGWRFVRLASKRKHGKISDNVFSDPELNAIAILGHGPEKFRLARKALMKKKHLLVDFPAAETVEKARLLSDEAIRNSTCIYSPNLLKTEPSLKELKWRTNDSTGRLLSLTVTCGFDAKRNSREFLMQVAQLLDAIEWLVDSKFAEVYCEKSIVRSSVSALVTLASFDNGVKAMLNIYSVGENANNTGLWVDSVCEDCVLRADPNGQSIRITSFHGERLMSVNWSIPSIVEAFESIGMRIDKARQPLELENLQRMLGMAEEIVGS
jgi:hypothetical protein